MPKVNITELVLRDGHQSLIATRMRTADMLPICDRLERVEDPWERLRKLRAALPNSRLQMLLRGQNLLGYRHYSDDVVRAFVAKCADNGMDVFRIFDALNDTRNLQVAIAAVKAAGKHAQGTICYTTSPVHNIDTFTAMAKELEAMGCDSIAVKDMAGLLTPMVAAELFKQLRAAVSLPVHLHMHATAGVAEMCQLKAIENGCLHIDTAISAFAGGASHPPTESMVAALAGTEYDTGLDLHLLQEIGFYFREVRRKYHQFESEFTGLDTRVQIYQVPGGMISNLYTQLREQGELSRMNDVFQEIPRVRQDLGYPPLVTPTSQIVGTQALLNVLTGGRYKTITNEVKLYLQGRYGHAPGAVNPVVRQQAIGNEDVIDVRPADLLEDEMDNLREEIGALAQNEEDVLSFAMFPEVGRDFLENRAANTLEPEPLEPLKPTQDAPVGRLTEFNVSLHGETYHIRVTGSGHPHQDQRPFYLTVDGVPEEILVESLQEIAEPPAANGSAVPRVSKGSKRPRATQAGHVTTSMPGTIVEVLVQVGASVKAGDPLIVAEAMKMETEIQAPIAGTVKAIHVAKGDSVNPDETLVEIG